MRDLQAAAFERLFRSQYAALVAFCFRRVDDYELAQDLTAETFRIAWDSWDQPRRSDRAWLFGVARNLIGNEYRSRASHRTARSGPDPISGRADEHSASGFEAVEVRAALAALPRVQQEVLQLTYWDGLSGAEAAEALGISTGTVWVRLTRARRAFALAWQERLSPESTVVKGVRR